MTRRDQRGAVLRGKFPLLWGTMRSTSGARSPPSHTLEREPLWGGLGRGLSKTHYAQASAYQGGAATFPHRRRQRDTSFPSFPCLCASL